MKVTQNNLLQHMEHDLRIGLIGQWKKYAIALIIFAILCGQFLSGYHSHIASPDRVSLKALETSLSFGDFIFYIFRGMRIFNPSDKEFTVNVFWVLINIYLAYIVSIYPFKDLSSYGQQMLMRSQKRSYWWISKCVWNIASVAAFYLLAYGTMAVYSIFTGNLDVMPHIAIQSYFSEMNVSGISAQTVLLIAFLLPFITSMSISLLQMTVSLLVRPIIGLVVTASILAASIFYCADWIPGNYLMLMRSDQVLPGSGVGSIFAIILSVVVSMVSIIMGLFIFKKRDIFQTE